MNASFTASRRRFIGLSCSGAVGASFPSLSLHANDIEAASIDRFQQLLGKTIQATTTAGTKMSIKLSVDAVTPLKPVENGVPGIRTRPFVVDVSGQLDQRLPDQIFRLGGPGTPEVLAMIKPLADLNPDDSKIQYEILFA